MDLDFNPDLHQRIVQALNDPWDEDLEMDPQPPIDAEQLAVELREEAAIVLPPPLPPKSSMSKGFVLEGLQVFDDLKVAEAEEPVVPVPAPAVKKRRVRLFPLAASAIVAGVLALASYNLDRLERSAGTVATLATMVILDSASSR